MLTLVLRWLHRGTGALRLRAGRVVAVSGRVRSDLVPALESICALHGVVWRWVVIGRQQAKTRVHTYGAISTVRQAVVNIVLVG